MSFELDLDTLSDAFTAQSEVVVTPKPQGEGSCGERGWGQVRAEQGHARLLRYSRTKRGSEPVKEKNRVRVGSGACETVRGQDVTSRAIMIDATLHQ